MKIKKPIKIEHLVNWYFGNFCARCGNIDRQDKNYGKDCWEKLQKLCEGLKDKEMLHREFVDLVRNSSTFCKPTKRIFHECPICKAIGKVRVNR